MKNVYSRKTRTLINTVSGLTNRLCNVILSFVLRTVFIKTLGMEYTGVSALFYDILTVLSFAELGIGTAIAASLYLPLHNNDESKIRELMYFYKTAYRFIALFVLIGGLIITPFLGCFVKGVTNISEDLRIVFVFYIIKSSFSYLLIYKSTLLIADQKQYQIKGIETICTIIRYIIEAVILVLFKNFLLYLLLEIVFTVMQNLIISKKAESQYPYAFIKNNNRLSKSEKTRLFKDIKGLAMYKISGTVGDSIDNILVSGYIGTIQVGYLSNYWLIKNQVEKLLEQFFQALTPSVGNLVTENNIKKQEIVFYRVYYLTFIVVNFCSCSLFVVINPFIALWLGDKYTLSISISFVLAFDFYLFMLLQIISVFRNANGLFVKGQYRPLIMAMMNIILSIVFIRIWGIFGTILATSICRIFTQWYDPFILFKYAFKSDFKKFYFVYLKYILLFLMSSIVTYNVSLLITITDPLIKCFLYAVCCVIIPNVISIFFTCKTIEFKYYYSFVKMNLKKMCNN